MNNQYNIEIWKDIPNYEGVYQVSTIGRVKSFKRVDPVIMKIMTSNVYPTVKLCMLGKHKTWTIHKLIAYAFLGYVTSKKGDVCDHKDNNPTNSILNNLQIISKRENCSKDRKGGTSKYTGVCWYKNKWLSSINIEGCLLHLGVFINEHDAFKRYQEALSLINNGYGLRYLKKTFVNKQSSEHKGVIWHKGHNKWRSVLYIKGKVKHLGYFIKEMDAYKAQQTHKLSI